MIIKLLHFFGLVRGIWLIDSWGEHKLSIMRRGPNGTFWARPFPFTGVGHVVLHDDGSTTGKSTYIKTWEPLP